MIQPQGLLRNQSGSGSVYPVEIAYSALCEEGFTAAGSIATNVTIGAAVKLTVVDTAYPLCDPTHHYLLTIAKVGTTATVYKQGVELGSYTTVATTDAELLTEALTTFAGAAKGYFSRIAVANAALTYSDFWRVSPAVPSLWVAKSLSGVTLSTLLAFTDALDLGADSSGNGNNWMLTNAVQSIDTPNNNFATLNPLAALENGSPGASNGNLTYCPGYQNYCCPSWYGMDSGLWYWEVAFSAVNNALVGITDNPNLTRTYVGATATSIGYHTSGGKYDDGVSSSVWGDTYTIGDVIGVLLNMDVGAIWYTKNGQPQGGATWAEIEAGDTTNAAKTGLTGRMFPATSGGGDIFTYDFGQNGYAYPPPEGFMPLCDASRAEPTYLDPAEYAHASTFVADGGGQDIELGFSAESEQFLCLLYNLTTAEAPKWFDSVTGLDTYLYPKGGSWTTPGTPCGAAGKVLTIPATWLTAGDTYSITVIRACPETGFEIHNVTNVKGAGTTVAHGLARPPQTAMVSSVAGAGIAGLVVYHEDLGDGAFIHSGGAATATRGGGYWHTVTATEFGIPDYDADEFPDGETVVYLFCDAEFGKVVRGITGNSSADGPYVDLGGRPLIIVNQKCANSTSAMMQYNMARDLLAPFNHSMWYGWSDMGEVTEEFTRPTSCGYKTVNADNNTNKSGGVSVCNAILRQTKYKNAY